MWPQATAFLTSKIAHLQDASRGTSSQRLNHSSSPVAKAKEKQSSKMRPSWDVGLSSGQGLQKLMAANCQKLARSIVHAKVLTAMMKMKSVYWQMQGSASFISGGSKDVLELNVVLCAVFTCFYRAMFNEKDLIESEQAGAGPAPELSDAESDADDLKLLDEAFAAGQQSDNEEDVDDLEDEFDVEEDNESEEDLENGCVISLIQRGVCI